MSEKKKINRSLLNDRTSVADIADILRDGPGGWPDGWQGWENVRLAHLQLLHELLVDLPPYPEEKFSGCGIVMSVTAKPGYSSGKFLKQGYLPAAWVAVKELRRLGCQLPILFTHLGPLEWDDTLTKLVAPLGVRVMDLEEQNLGDPSPMRILAGWESKVYSILQSPFEKVIFLDADNIPLRDPTYLLELSQLKHYKAMLWPDVPPYDRKDWLPKEVWHNIGLDHHAEVRACESGQLVIDKRGWWEELQVCRWMNEHSDWFYKFIFGDKDTFVLAPHVVQALDPAQRILKYFMIQRPPGGPGFSLVHYDVDGNALFQHCTRNKADINGYPEWPSILPRDYANEHLKELRSLWNGNIWDNVNPSDEEVSLIHEISGRKWVYVRDYEDKKHASRPMTFVASMDRHHGTPVLRVGQGMAKCEVLWSAFSKNGKPANLVLKDVDGSVTCIMQGDVQRGFHGKWLVHERNPCHLLPAQSSEGACHESNAEPVRGGSAAV